MEIAEFLKEFMVFLLRRKKLWLIPMSIVFLAVGLLITLTHGSVVAPFIYTVF